MESERFGAMIRRRRLVLGFSQDWLANQAGTDRSHLSKIERGSIEMPAEPLRSELLRVLDAAERDRGIPVEHVISGRGGITLGGSLELAPEERHPVDTSESLDPTDDPWMRVVFSGMPNLSEAGRRLLAEHFEYIKQIEEEYRREAERDAAENRGKD